LALKESLALVENMRLAVIAAHQIGAVLVDANEMNYLADGTTPRLLDVDSWQIGPYQPSAIMPSISDVHSTWIHATDRLVLLGGGELSGAGGHPSLQRCAPRLQAR
jgi:hypothetical protein